MQWITRAKLYGVCRKFPRDLCEGGRGRDIDHGMGRDALFDKRRRRSLQRNVTRLICSAESILISLLFQNITSPFRHSHCDLYRKLICHWFVCTQNCRVYSLAQREQYCWVWQIWGEKDRQTNGENPTAQWLPERSRAVPIAVRIRNVSCTRWIENEANAWLCKWSRKAVPRSNVPVRMKGWEENTRFYPSEIKTGARCCWRTKRP